MIMYSEFAGSEDLWVGSTKMLVSACKFFRNTMLGVFLKCESPM